MSSSTATKSVIMSPKVLTFVVILISMCGTVISDVQPVGVNQSSNSSLSHSSSSQSGSISALSPEKSSDSSSQVSAQSGVSATKVGVAGVPPSNISKPDCGGKPCGPDVKAPSSQAVQPNDSADPSDDLSKKLNPEALMRGFYVFVGLSIIVMAYLAWKSFGKRPAGVHRYGVVGNGDDLEMAPIDSDDGDDDDTTHFDISSHRLQT